VDIFCACPFAVALLGWEPAPGRRSLSVCVKATFVLVPGAPSTIAPLQEPFRIDGASGAAPDLVPFKPRVDVLFTGHAHAPGGAPTDSLIARARVGAFRKSLSINGDRTWVPSFDGLRPSVAVPFRHMPLSYERAVRTGENLTGVDISQGAEPNCPLANIAAIADQGGETPGLAPIPLAWRALRLGIGDAGLVWASRAGLVPGPPPAGFDFRLFNAAPAEQQLDDLPPGAEVILENLHPELPRLETRLPALRVKLFRRPPRSESSLEVPTRCDTLWIDTDRGLAMLLWRGAVLVEGAGDDSVGRLVVTAELEGERVGPADVDRMLSRLAPDVTYVDPTALHGAPGGYPAVPDPIPVPSAPPVPPSLSPSAPPAPAALARSESYPPAPPRPAGDVLEVGADEVESLDDRPTPVPEERPGPITLVPPPAEPSAVHALPFRPAPGGEGASPSEPRSAPPPSAALPAAWSDDDTEVTPPRGYPALAALRAPLPPASPSPPAVDDRDIVLPDPAGLPTAALPPPPSTAAEAPMPAAPAEPAAEPQADPYCALKMEIWRGDAPVGDVLARRGIDEASFRAHEAAQLEALGREAADGRSEMAIALLEGLADAARGG